MRKYLNFQKEKSSIFYISHDSFLYRSIWSKLLILAIKRGHFSMFRTLLNLLLLRVLDFDSRWVNRYHVAKVSNTTGATSETGNACTSIAPKIHLVLWTVSACCSVFSVLYSVLCTCWSFAAFSVLPLRCIFFRILLCLFCLNFCFINLLL